MSTTQQELPDCDNTQRREEYRSQWHLLKEKHPELTKTELRSLEPGIYAWLYRHDRSWIVCDVVSTQHRQPRRERVNWRLRDAELALKVLDAAIALYRQSDKPVRVTMSRLGKITGSLGLLEKHINRLPATNQVLKDVLEDLEEFQIRRVKWAARQLSARGRPIKRWNLFRVAGLKPGLSPSIELCVDSEVAEATKLEGITDWP